MKEKKLGAIKMPLKNIVCSKFFFKTCCISGEITLLLQKQMLPGLMLPEHFYSDTDVPTK